MTVLSHRRHFCEKPCLCRFRQGGRALAESGVGLRTEPGKLVFSLGARGLRGVGSPCPTPALAVGIWTDIRNSGGCPASAPADVRWGCFLLCGALPPKQRGSPDGLQLKTQASAPGKMK